MDIMTGLSAISETLKITKELRAVDSRISDAEWKLRLADMVDKLLEAKEALIDAKENEASLHDEILALKKASDESGQFTDDNGLLFEIDDSGNRIGKPFCNQCYVKVQKKFRLIYHAEGKHTRSHFHCSNCDNAFKG